MRKILDAGGTPESARKEIEDVRNANALFEARKVDDREYQAKSLIQRMSMARGVTPMTREPLNQSSSIDNPQRSQAMSQAMGMPGEGFGTSPLDMNRQFMTPDFYKKYLRKSAMTQESADEQSAFNSLLSRGQLEVPSTGSFSFATLKGQERQNQVELVAEGLESRLESLRARGRRIKKPLPSVVISKFILNKLYENKGAKPGKEVLFSLETIQEMSSLQLLIALNIASIASRRGYEELKSKLSEFTIPTSQAILPAEGTNLIANLKELVQYMNKEEPNIEIPFASATMRVDNKQIADILIEIRTNSSLKVELQKAHKQYMDWMAVWEELIKPDAPPAPVAPPAPEMTQAPIPGAKFGRFRELGKARDAKALENMSGGDEGTRAIAISKLRQVIKGIESETNKRNKERQPPPPFRESRGKQPKGKYVKGVVGIGSGDINWNDYTVIELKEFLSKRQMIKSGNKDELIARLNA